MRAHKIAVMVMAVMLLEDVTALLGFVAGRVSRGGPTPAAVREFASLPIDIPRGARIEAMTAGPDRVILALLLPDGGRQLVVIDLARGARLGTIELRPVP